MYWIGKTEVKKKVWSVNFGVFQYEDNINKMLFVKELLVSSCTPKKKAQDRITFWFYLLNFSMSFKSACRTFSIFIYSFLCESNKCWKFLWNISAAWYIDKTKLQRAYRTDKTQLGMSFNYNLSWHLSKIVFYFVITLLQVQVWPIIRRSLILPEKSRLIYLNLSGIPRPLEDGLLNRDVWLSAR